MYDSIVWLEVLWIGGAACLVPSLRVIYTIFKHNKVHSCTCIWVHGHFYWVSADLHSCAVNVWVNRGADLPAPSEYQQVVSCRWWGGVVLMDWTKTNTDDFLGTWGGQMKGFLSPPLMDIWEPLGDSGRHGITVGDSSRWWGRRLKVQLKDYQLLYQLKQKLGLGRVSSTRCAPPGWLLDHSDHRCEEARMERSLSECDIRLIIQKEGGLTSQCWSCSSIPESCLQVRRKSNRSLLGRQDVDDVLLMTHQPKFSFKWPISALTLIWGHV